jgi:hypothetical protein
MQMLGDVLSPDEQGKLYSLKTEEDNVYIYQFGMPGSQQQLADVGVGMGGATA